MARYSSTPLVKKLGIKEGMSVWFVDAPDNYQELLGDLPKHTSKEAKDNVDFIHFFTRSRETLSEEFEGLKKRLKPTGMLWISWPKSSCSFANSNLTEHVVRAIGLENGLVDVKVAAIDENWSGLKFVYRVKDRVLS